MGEGVYEKKSDNDGHIAIMHYKESGNGLHVLPHFHGAVEYAILVQGEYVYHVDKKDYTMKPGDGIFVDSRQLHYCKVTGEIELWVIVFDKKFLEGLELDEKTLPSFLPSNEAKDEIIALFNNVWTVWWKASRLYKIGTIYQLMGSLLRHYEAVKRVNAGEDMFIDVMSYIEEHYTEELKLEEMAELFGYTVSYFSRRFNELFSMSIREYINRRRMREVNEIMENQPKLPLTKVMTMVGYKSWNTFYRNYVKYCMKKPLRKTSR